MGDSEGLDVGDVVGGDVTTGGGIGGQTPAQTAAQVPPCWGVPLTQAAAATVKLKPGGRLPLPMAFASAIIFVSPVVESKKRRSLALARNEKTSSLRPSVGGGMALHTYSSNSNVQLKRPSSPSNGLHICASISALLGH